MTRAALLICMLLSAIASGANGSTLPLDPLVNVTGNKYVNADFYQIHDVPGDLTVHNGIDVTSDSWSSGVQIVVPMYSGHQAYVLGSAIQIFVAAQDPSADGSYLVVTMLHVQGAPYLTMSSYQGVPAGFPVGQTTTDHHVHFEVNSVAAVGNGWTVPDADVSPLRNAFESASWSNTLGTTEIGDSLFVRPSCGLYCDYVDFEFDARVNSVSGFPLGIGGCQISVTGIPLLNINVDFGTYLTRDYTTYFRSNSVKTGNLIPYKFRFDTSVLGLDFNPSTIKQATVTIYNSKQGGYLTKVFGIGTTRVAADITTTVGTTGAVRLSWRLSQSAAPGTMSVYRVTEGGSDLIGKRTVQAETNVTYDLADTAPPAFWTDLDYRIEIETETGKFEAGRAHVRRHLPSLSLIISPNPASSVVTLGIEAKAIGVLEIAVYDVAGRRVRGLYSQRIQHESTNVEWDRTGDQGERVPGGVYFVKARLNGDTIAKKVVLLR